MNDPQAFCAGLVQLCSGRDVTANISQASGLIREAATWGADFVATPEMTNLLDSDRDRAFASVREEKEDMAPKAFSELAAELGLYLLIGSLALRSGSGRLVNRSLLFSPKGNVIARYDKIHMFDVDLGAGQVYRESSRYEAGSAAVIAQLPWLKVGLTTCYDLRFPFLYGSLARAGAYLMAVPSAFTGTTGEAHWEVLLRARAIECAAFIIAPAQTGYHDGGRESFGHSLAVGPWGEVLVDGGRETGVSIVEVYPSLVREARSSLPVLSHERPWRLLGRADGQVKVAQ